MSYSVIFELHPMQLLNAVLITRARDNGVISSYFLSWLLLHICEVEEVQFLRGFILKTLWSINIFATLCLIAVTELAKTALNYVANSVLISMVDFSLYVVMYKKYYR